MILKSSSFSMLCFVLSSVVLADPPKEYITYEQRIADIEKKISEQEAKLDEMISQKNALVNSSRIQNELDTVAKLIHGFSESRHSIEQKIKKIETATNGHMSLGPVLMGEVLDSAKTLEKEIFDIAVKYDELAAAESLDSEHLKRVVSFFETNNKTITDTIKNLERVDSLLERFLAVGPSHLGSKFSSATGDVASEQNMMDLSSKGFQEFWGKVFDEVLRLDRKKLALDRQNLAGYVAPLLMNLDDRARLYGYQKWQDASDSGLEKRAFLLQETERLFEELQTVRISSAAANLDKIENIQFKYLALQLHPDLVNTSHGQLAGDVNFYKTVENNFAFRDAAMSLSRPLRLLYPFRRVEISRDLESGKSRWSINFTRGDDNEVLGVSFVAKINWVMIATFAAAYTVRHFFWDTLPFEAISGLETVIAGVVAVGGVGYAISTVVSLAQGLYHLGQISIRNTAAFSRSAYFKHREKKILRFAENFKQQIQKTKLCEFLLK